MHLKDIPSSLAAVMGAFAPCFAKPTHARFVVLVLGWLLCWSRRWITRVILAAAGLSMGHHAASYRLFSEASWRPTDVWRTLFLRLLRHVPGVVELIIDDTLCRRSAPRIFGISMHYDSANSAYRLSAGHRASRTACGHSWVVLAMRVPTPWPGPGVAVPIHARPLPIAQALLRRRVPDAYGAGRRDARGCAPLAPRRATAALGWRP